MNNNNFCIEKGYDNYNEENHNLISCCRTTSFIDGEGNFVKECKVFEKEE